MTYAYNSNLDFYDRVHLVTEEICHEYPLISQREAKEAAACARAVDDHITNDDKFNRLYYILLTIGRTHDEFYHVFNDLYKVYDEGVEQSLYRNIMPQIVDYAIGDRGTFPIFLEG